MSKKESAPTQEVINLCEWYKEHYKCLLRDHESYYQLIKSINSDDTSGGLLAYYLLYKNDSTHIFKSINKENIEDSMFYLRFAAYSLNLSFKITANKPSKEEILEHKDNIKKLSIFIKKNRYVNFMYRIKDDPHRMGSYLKSHLERHVDKLNPIKDPNFMAKTLDVKNTLRKGHEKNISDNELMYGYFDMVFPEVHEVLDTLGGYFEAMSEKQPIIKRYNSKNIELQCFCRIFNEIIYNNKKKRNYKLIADFAEIIFNDKTDIVIDVEYVKSICRTKYDT